MRILSIDIGGTFIKYAVMDENAEIIRRGKLPTPQTGREEFVAELTGLYERQTGAEREIAGVAISMPGIIDSARGYCYMGGALRYNNDFALGEALKKGIDVPISMENDAKCAALAEAAKGSLADVADGFVLTFGTMIGGGYIKDHKLHRGRHFSAGEVSYILTDTNAMAGEENVWGNRCGTPRLCRLFAKRRGLAPESVDGERFFAAVNAGEEDAIDCLNSFAHDVAVQIFNLQTLLDPERFAIGGGISAQSAFLSAVRDNLEALYASCPYPVPHAEIVACSFLNDANLYGALQCFLAEYGSAH